MNIKKCRLLTIISGIFYMALCFKRLRLRSKCPHYFIHTELRAVLSSSEKEVKRRLADCGSRKPNSFNLQLIAVLMWLIAIY